VRFETFCYGPKSCALYRAGPTRKVPGRKGMSWEEEDWVDEEELLGTKLRALYQRKKGRDLFDLSQALTRLAALDPDRVVACFLRYLEHSGFRVTRTEFEENLAAKLADEVFLRDVPPLLGIGISYDRAAAFARVREVLLARLPERASKRGRRR